MFDYLFGPTIDRDGQRHGFSRFDISLWVVFIFSSMITIAYWAQRSVPMESEDWRRIGVAGSISLLILVISRIRIVCIVAALAFLGVRLIAVPFLLPSPTGHRLSMFLGGAGCLLAAGVVLRLRISKS